eukprot:GHVL01016890.1.p2 GENE.GHVL01016890.1~~GHVL01016890.1.p2  ORF type:complete len:135 (+),score=28.83 GHVL01016890.1:396-800(+)
MIGPLARGENLIEIMKNNRVAQLAIDWIIYQLLRILAKIKEYDLLIGDIKLESIIVDENFDITLIDFFPGIPKFPAVSVGYISPEQLEDVTTSKTKTVLGVKSNSSGGHASIEPTIPSEKFTRSKTYEEMVFIE